MKIKETKLSDNYCVKKRQSTEYSWDIPTILEYIKEKKYKTFDLLLDGIDFNVMFWDIENFWDILKHVKRMNSVNTKHPIILDEEGTIIDGWHRVLRAASENRKSIKAVRLEEMPKASSISTL